MSEPRPELDADLEAELEEMARLEEEARENRPSIPRLVDAADVEGLLALAKVFRSGDETTPRDFVKCVEAYEAAASLGSTMGAHAAGVFHMTGGPVPRDEAKAASHFRTAADAGYIPSKVYLANLYELGIHYGADAKKAGVWYRSVARSADIEHSDDSEAYVVAMAELGCVRYCLKLADDDETSEDDRALYLRKARAHGYRPDGTPAPTKQVRIDSGERASEPERRPALAATEAADDEAADDDAADDDASLDLDDLAFLDAAVAAEAAGGGLVSANTGDESKAKPRARAKDKGAKDKGETDRDESAKDAPLEKEAGKTEKPVIEKKAATRSTLTWRTGFAAFLYAMVFMAVAVGAGFGLTAWAESLVAAGESAPLVGQQPALFLLLAIGTIGLLPNFLIYRARAVGKAVIAGGLFAILGEALWGLGHQLLGHLTQVTLFTAAGLLLGLLVLGIGGEARDKSKKALPKKSSS